MDKSCHCIVQRAEEGGEKRQPQMRSIEALTCHRVNGVSRSCKNHNCKAGRTNSCIPAVFTGYKNMTPNGEDRQKQNTSSN